MPIVEEQKIRSQIVKEIAQRMLIAARTAPKGKGQDNTVLLLVDGAELKKLSDHLKEMGTKLEHLGFIRDAENILQAEALLLFGSRIKSMGLKKCGMCGFKNCAAKDEHPNIPCVMNTGDLGIAIGSAVSVAMDNRIDNRIMYSVGQAAMDMGIFEKDVKIAYAVPLSATSKNPFFDRK